MNRLIVIIHSSEIIRKGLAAIIRNYFNIEILQLEKTGDLNDYREMKNNTLLIIIQDSVKIPPEPLHTIRKNNQVKLIAYKTNTGTQTSIPYDCEECINDETTAIELQEIISKCLKSGERNIRNHENDELSIREKEVLHLVALGCSNKVIAEKLYISIHTVISHRKNISEKTGIKSISGLTVYAILNKLIDTNSINPEDLI